MGWFGTKTDKDITKEEKEAARKRMEERRKKSTPGTYGIGTGHEKKRSPIFEEFRDKHK